MLSILLFKKKKRNNSLLYIVNLQCLPVVSGSGLILSVENGGASLGGFQVFPPPSTPPEPAPPDRGATPQQPQVPPRWQLLHSAAASSSLPTASSHTSLDEAASDVSCSRESLSTSQTGWLDDSVFLRRSKVKGDIWGPSAADTYSHRAFTTGRRRFPPPQPSGNHSHVGKQQFQQQHHPGKLNLKEFANVTDAIARMNLGTGGKEGGSIAPPPPPPRLAKMKESHAHRAHFGSYDGDYNYTPTQESGGSVSSSKPRNSRYRREKGRPAAYSDSDSDCSSLERRNAGQGSGGGESSSRPHRKSSTHKRPRRKRAAIPVATPRVPPLPSSSIHQTPPPGIPLPLSARPRGTDLATTIDKANKIRDPGYGPLPDDESSVDVSSPRDRDIGSPMIGFMSRQRDRDSGGGSGAGDREHSKRRREKAKAKEDEKQEKRRLKEEERQRREKEKDEKKRKSKGGLGIKAAATPAPILEDIVQNEGRSIPLFLEKCVQFIEEEGLDSEGIYRVPGNRAHVDILFQKFEEDPNLNIRDLDIAVNAVATALKDFFSKRFPPVLTAEQMDELEEISMTSDRSCRLLALRGLLKRLSSVRFDVLKFIFQHFVKVTENCKANSMDSKNLAICWWPTLLPFEFTDMGRFELMRPHLEDTVQAMIDQFPFLFLGKDEVVMV